MSCTGAEHKYFIAIELDKYLSYDGRYGMCFIISIYKAPGLSAGLLLGSNTKLCSSIHETEESPIRPNFLCNLDEL